MAEIHYLIIGAGGIGGSIAGTLATAGKNVTLIARGQQLEALRRSGLVLVSDFGGRKEEKLIPPGKIDVCSQEEYTSPDEPPVIFLCVKSYSIEDVAPFLDLAAQGGAFVIPILNGMRMGEYIRGFVKQGRILDGCTYLSAMKDGPGRFLMKGDRFRLVFGGDGLHKSSTVKASQIEYIAEDLRSAGIDAEASDDILSHTVKKAAFVASCASTGLYYDVKVRELQKPGKPRDMITKIAGEMSALAQKMGIVYGFDLAEDILTSLDGLSPDTESSLQRDIAQGGRSEFDSLVAYPIRIAQSCGLEMPALKTVKDAFEERASSQKKHIS